MEDKIKDEKEKDTQNIDTKETQPDVVEQKENKKADKKESKKEIKQEEKKNENIKEKSKESAKADVKEKAKEKDESKEYKQVKVKKRSILPIILATILICAIIFFSVIFALININNNKIMSGISILGIDMSDLTQEEAKNKLNQIIEEKMNEDIELKHLEYETTINANQLSGKLDIEKAISEAYNIGREGNIVLNNYQIIFTKIFKKNIDAELYVNEEILNEKIEDISLKIPGAVKQSSYYVEDEKLIIVKGNSGEVVKAKLLEQNIKDEIKKVNSKNNVIEIPTEYVEPEKIDIEKIRQEIYKEPKDAYVSKNPTKVHTHVNGVDFKISIDEAKKMLQKDKEEYVIPLKITIPKKTLKDLGKEAFPELLATYTTRYDPTNYNRSNNIMIASNKIDGTIVMPGEIFSYNKVVGARTIQAGFKLAGAYAGGKVVQDVGGGICQNSSTLYNTALLANLEIVERSNHQFLTSYVAPSRDATVSWGSLDFKFRNSRKYPIKVVSSAKNGVCTMSIYGIKEETEYEVIIQSKTTSYIAYNVKYIEDSSIEQGKEVVEQSGYNGCKSEAYRILKLNGKVVSKTLLSRDTYDPMQRIVRKGTKRTVNTSIDNKENTDKNINSNSLIQ